MAEINIKHFSPQSGRVLKEDSEYINTADLWVGGNTIFNQKIVVEPTQQFVYKSVFPISTQRDNTTLTGDGTAAKVNGSEYRLRATTGTVMFQTKQKGDYIPYLTLVPGLALRTLGALTGSAKMQWGYFDYDAGITNGTFVEYNANGIFHKVVKSGTEVYSQEITVNVEKGKIFQFPFVYYGYGFAGLDVVETNKQGLFIGDRRSTYLPDGETIMNESNLPLTIRVEGGGTQIDAYVGGRHMTVLGKSERTFRTVTETRKEAGSIASTNYVPLLSTKVKSAYSNIFVEIGNVEIMSDSDMELAVFTNGTLTGATFGVPADYVGSEVATEWDNSATAITDGNQIYGGLIAGGTGKKTTFTGVTLPDKPIVDGDTISFCLRKISGAGGTASMNAKVRENW